jgi:hypothetical protein
LALGELGPAEQENFKVLLQRAEVSSQRLELETGEKNLV